MQSQGIVIEIFEHKGRRLIAFPTHAGLFTTPPGDDELAAMIRASFEQEKEISFEFDKELTILRIWWT